MAYLPNTWLTRNFDIPQADLQPTADPNVFLLRLDTSFRSEVRRLEATEEGIVFPGVINVNPQVNIGSVTLASVVEVINNYTFTFEDGQYAVNFDGANTNLQDRTVVNQVSIRPNNSAGLVASKQAEDIAFTDARVWIDTFNGLPGTVYPRGTPSDPVDNLRDALTIIEQRLLPKRLNINGALTIDEDLDDFNVLGSSPRLAELTLTGKSVNRARFTNVSITGDFAGGPASQCTLERGVSLSNVSNFAGNMLEVGLQGTIGFADAPGDNVYELVRCYSVVPGTTTPILDFNNITDLNINIRGYTGGITVREFNDPDNLMSIDMDPALVILDSTVTQGIVVIRGVGRVISSAGVNVTLVTEGVVSGQELNGKLNNNAALIAGLYG